MIRQAFCCRILALANSADEDNLVLDSSLYRIVQRFIFQMMTKMSIGCKADIAQLAPMLYRSIMAAAD